MMKPKDKVVTLLEKRLENRENTIKWLNDLIDGQSRKIDDLNNVISELKSDSDNCQELKFKYNSACDKIKSQVKEIQELKNENNLLKKEFVILFNAFHEVKEDLLKGFDSGDKQETVETVSESDEKKRHKKELMSPQWKKKREEVFERYGEQCVECGRTSNIHVHHLVYRNGRHIWEYPVDELIPLCKSCHKKVHDDKNHKFHEKYLP